MMKILGNELLSTSREVVVARCKVRIILTLVSND
jgi:hypothetical protein